MKKKWGFTTGVQSTRINMAPITQTSTQNQDNWLLSVFSHHPSTTWPGRWSFQIDTHQIYNDASQSMTSRVNAIAPQITWLSYSAPLKLDLSYANSKYKNTAAIQQISPAIAYGFNNSNDWLQIRGYAINHLDPANSFGQSHTYATDISLTHFLKEGIKLAPSTVTLGLERGKRIYVVDMTAQTIYNLPMRNEGGEKVAANWILSPSTNINLQYSKTRYFSDIPVAPTAHQFSLKTLSAQLSTAW